MTMLLHSIVHHCEKTSTYFHFSFSPHVTQTSFDHHSRCHNKLPSLPNSCMVDTTKKCHHAHHSHMRESLRINGTLLGSHHHLFLFLPSSFDVLFFLRVSSSCGASGSDFMFLKALKCPAAPTRTRTQPLHCVHTKNHALAQGASSHRHIRCAPP